MNPVARFISPLEQKNYSALIADRVLGIGLDGSMQKFKADLVIYLAGADPYLDDRFGRISLTKEGLAKRDRLVFQHLHQAGLPVAITMAGGYARKVQDAVDINFQTIQSALEFKKNSS